MKTVLVTGGAGFIGANMVKYLAKKNYELVVVDHVRETWNRKNFCSLTRDLRIRMHSFDLCDRDRLAALFEQYSPEWVMHLAAESHVDKSIAMPNEFISANVKATLALLECITAYWNRSGRPENFRFHYCSTDEVYGSLGPVGSFHEKLPLHPNNPYSATKAAGEHLVTAWINTYGLPAVMTRSSNNYGPCQGPDKFIPLTIGRCLNEKPVLIHGTGRNVRDWIHVNDHVRAIHAVLENGLLGEAYNIGGGPESERTNLAVAERICDLMDEAMGRKAHTSRERMTLTDDRPGNDMRYSMDTKKLHLQTGWQPEISFDDGLRKTVDWYLQNEDYCASLND